MTKAKPPKTKELKAPKLKEIYGKKAPDYARRQKKVDPKTFEEELSEDVRQNLEWSIEARAEQKPADDDVHALVRGLKALAKGSIIVVPLKKKPKKKP